MYVNVYVCITECVCEMRVRYVGGICHTSSPIVIIVPDGHDPTTMTTFY